MTDKDPSPFVHSTQDGGSRPVPDPTILTTQQIENRIVALEKLLMSQIDGLKDLYESKLAGIEKQFDAIEAWRKEQKLDTKTAVDAALQAAEKAVREQTVASEKAITKSETSSTEQAKQQFATFSANLNGLSIVVNDVKERVLRIESRKEGEVDNKIVNREQRNDNQYLVFAVVGIFLTALAIGVPVAVALTR